MSNKNKWEALSLRDRAFLIREAVRNGITDMGSIKDAWEHRFDGLQDIVEKVKTSDKDFAKRLRQEGRASIPDWEDPNGRRIATHKLSVATDENGIHYIYPEVQNVNGQLVDFTNPKTKGYNWGSVIAAERGDTIQVGKTRRDLENAIRFTEGYKDLGIFPEFSAPPHKYSGDEPTLSGFPEGYIPPEYTYRSPEVYATAMDHYWIPWIQKVENEAKVGYDKDTDTWAPHPSVEGGAGTIGYGFKLSAHPELVELLKNNNGRISTKDLNAYAKKFYLNNFTTTAKIWNAKYGKDKSFERLPPELQVLLADKQYNVQNGGLNTYPKFMEAIANERFEDIIREGRVNVRNGQGELVPLGRNKHIENMVRELQRRLEEEKINGLPGLYWNTPAFIVKHIYSGELNTNNDNSFWEYLKQYLPN